MKTYTSLYIFLLLLLLPAACTDDAYRDNGGGTPAGDHTAVTFTLQVPEGRQVDTRAMDTADENRLETLWLLAFEEGTTSETFAYARKATSLTKTGVNTYTAQVSLLWSTASEKYRLVLLANAEDPETVIASFTTTTTKAEAMQAFTFSEDKAWPTGDGTTTTARAIPMWGETAGTAVVDRNTTLGSFGANTLYLLRALARIDLIVKLEKGPTWTYDPNGKGLFEIQQVKIHHNRKTGYIAPVHGNYSHTTRKVDAPSLYTPTGGTAELVDPGKMVFYPGTNNSIESEIYVQETNDADPASKAEPLCLLVEANYYLSETIAVPYWYRIDLFDDDDDLDDDEWVYLNILRNHLYQLTITEVKGEGYATEKEALEGGPGNLTTKLSVWTDGTLKHFAFDGQYLLGISWDSLRINNRQATYTIEVATNHPDGFRTTVLPGTTAAFLTPSTPDEVSNDGTTTLYRLEIEAAAFTDPTLSSRWDTLRFTTGKLELKAVVQQVNSQYTFELDVFRKGDTNKVPLSEINFPSTYGDPANYIPGEFWVDWYPSDLYCIVSDDPVTSAFQGEINYNSDQSDTYTGQTNALGALGHLESPEGKAGFRIIPTPFTADEIKDNPFISRHSRWGFGISDNITAHFNYLDVKQINYALIADTVRERYRMGTIYRIPIRSNAPWQCEIISNSSTPARTLIKSITIDGGTFDMNTLTGTGGPGDDTPQTAWINLQLAYNTAWYEEKFTIKLSRADAAKPLNTVEVPVIADCVLPNNYTTQPGIPVSIRIKNIPDIYRAEGFDNSLQLGTNIHLAVVWQDSLVIANPSAPILPDNNGASGWNRTFTVPVNGAGNAVVALVHNTDTIWSWHIWSSRNIANLTASTLFHHNGFEFMDSYLGAGVTLLTDRREGDDMRETIPHTYGLHYQWGRKDPYPPTSSYKYVDWDSGNRLGDVKQLNYGGYSALNTGYIPDGQDSIHLLYTFQHPGIFLYPSAAPGDWFTKHQKKQRDDLWNTEANEKSMYDPCPDGWRIPAERPYTGVADPIPGEQIDNGEYGLYYNDPTFKYGYIPVNGILSGANGHPTNVQAFTRIWYAVASIATGTASNLNMDALLMQANPGNQDNRFYGLMVRCVKDKQASP